MLIAEYLKQEWIDTPYILQYAQDRLLATIHENKTTENYKALEEYLNEQFYGNTKDTSQFFYNTLQLYIKETGKKLETVGNTYSWSTDLKKPEFDIETKLLQFLRDFKNKTKVQLEQILKLQKVLENYDKKILQYLELSKEEAIYYKQLVQDILRILTELLDIGTISIDKIKGNSYDFYLNGSAEIFLVLQTYIPMLFGEVKLTPNESGELFEMGLALLNSEHNEVFQEQITEEMVDIIKKNKSGNIKAERTGLYVTAAFKEKDYTKKTKKQHIQVGDENFSIKADLSDAKQVKADVKLTIPNINNTFQISAKNWESIATGKKYGLGETSIMSAVIRSLTSSSALEHYIFAVGPTKRNDNQISSFLELSKLSLAVDIIRGNFVDKKYNADTLVINDRKNQQIHVYSVAQLLYKIVQKTTQFSFKGFNQEDILEQIRLLLKAQTDISYGEEQTRLYKSAVIDYLNGVHVTLLMNSF